VKRLRAVVRGRVQGVGYRATTAQQGKHHGIAGWVRNLVDGSVEVVAEGDDKAVLAFLDYLRRGPNGARVTNVDTEWTDARSDLQGFEIR
jgi:acylphosphatase